MVLQADGRTSIGQSERFDAKTTHTGTDGVTLYAADSRHLSDKVAMDVSGLPRSVGVPLHPAARWKVTGE